MIKSPSQTLIKPATHCKTKLKRLRRETGQIENFTTADGLPNSNVEVAFRDKNNQLWFTTGEGIVRFRPEPEHTRRQPNVLITGLRVGGVSQAVSILGETAIPELNRILFEFF